MKARLIEPRFVEFVPGDLEPGILYVCANYGTVVHLCCCGCGHEVVTPLSPRDWRFSYDGEHLSLSPSVGNWSLACRSHYWIRDNQVRWAGRWTQAQIDAARAFDRGSGGSEALRREDAVLPTSWWSRAVTRVRKFGRPA